MCGVSGVLTEGESDADTMFRPPNGTVTFVSW
jgi:hypothetical protein